MAKKAKQKKSAKKKAAPKYERSQFNDGPPGFCRPPQSEGGPPGFVVRDGKPV